jgi:hypothetical protein
LQERNRDETTLVISAPISSLQLDWRERIGLSDDRKRESEGTSTAFRHPNRCPKDLEFIPERVERRRDNRRHDRYRWRLPPHRAGDRVALC